MDCFVLDGVVVVEHQHKLVVQAGDVVDQKESGSSQLAVAGAIAAWLAPMPPPLLAPSGRRRSNSSKIGPGRCRLRPETPKPPAAEAGQQIR